MDTKVFTTEDTQNAMKSLENKGITEHFITHSMHAPVPEILNFPIKLAYQAAGLSDEKHHLTPLGKEFFEQVQNYVKAKEAKTGIKYLDLPKVWGGDCHMD